MYRVVFINEKNVEVEKNFSNYYECWKFINKAKHSKRIRLVAYPCFYD